MLKVRKYLFALALIASVTAPPALAQAAKPYVGEVVMTASGELSSDWKEVRTCATPDRCRLAVINMKTHEGARLGERWATKFEATGNGKEIRRAETTLAKATRLKPAASPK